MTRPTIFLSTPATLTVAQEVVQERWAAWLFAAGLTVQRLYRRDYDRTPWARLGAMLQGADAVVVLGFGQLHVLDGVWRPGTIEEERVVACTKTSPWLQIEAAMAVMLGLPTLVAAERGVVEGVFHADSWTEPLFGASLEEGPAGPAVAEWRAAMELRRSCGVRDGNPGCAPPTGIAATTSDGRGHWEVPGRLLKSS
jgi:hypothetical protein